MSGLPAIATVELTSRFGSFVPRCDIDANDATATGTRTLIYGGIVLWRHRGQDRHRRSPRKICSGVVVEHIRPEQSGQDQFLRSPLL
jgi:hypothetical protein